MNYMLAVGTPEIWWDLTVPGHPGFGAALAIKALTLAALLIAFLSLSAWVCRRLCSDAGARSWHRAANFARLALLS